MEEIIQKVILCESETMIEVCNIQSITVNTIKSILNGDFKDKFAVNVEYSLIYQKIYLGKFNEVPEYFIRMFALLSFLRAFIKSFKTEDSGDLQESLFIVDLGIVMASGFQETEPLTLFADYLHDLIGT